MLDKQGALYQVYVLRLWRDGPGAPWRAALECSRTGERFPFADLPALFAFLESETLESEALESEALESDALASQMAALPVDHEDSGRGEKSQTSDA